MMAVSMDTKQVMLHLILLQPNNGLSTIRREILKGQFIYQIFDDI